MSEHSQHDLNAGKSGASHARKLTCEEWEALLVDFLDDALATGESAGFHAHRQSCQACGEMFSQAGQGREWLGFLRTEPVAPATLVGRILAQTSGAESRPGLNSDLVPAPAAVPATPVLPFWKRGGMAATGRQMAQPRLLMTAAMAFFSITLTLNMAGVRLTSIRLADLNPSTLSSNLTKQYHTTSARVVRYYDSLRFVYEMEAQLREMRQNSDMEKSTPVEKPEQNTPSTAPQDGGHKSGGKSQIPANPVSPEQRSSVLWGEKIDAALRNPFEELPATPAPFIVRGGMETKLSNDGIETTDSRAADQAERGIA